MGDERQLGTYVIVAPDGVAYVGIHAKENDAWRIYLGWPSDDEIAAKIKQGYYAARATLTWNKPT